MGSILVHEFISLDGVIEDPSWTFAYPWDPKMGERLGAVTGRSKGILLGRKTFEMFAPAWSTRTAEDDEGAPFFNDTTKYVVSSTLEDAEAVWRNSEVVGTYDPETIRKLKETVDGDLYISGSGQLVRALLADGLIDELHLCMFPTTRGAGDRLFDPGAEPTAMVRAEADVYDNGVLYLCYKPAAAA